MNDLAPQSSALIRQALKLKDLDGRMAKLQEVIGKKRTRHIYATGDNRQVTVISLSTDRKRTRVDRVFKRLMDDAKKQLPSIEAGVLVVEFAEQFSDDQAFFNTRGENDILRKRIENLFSRRPHLLGISFISGRSSKYLSDKQDLASSARSLSFTNREHRFARDSNLIDFFGA